MEREDREGKSGWPAKMGREIHPLDQGNLVSSFKRFVLIFFSCKRFTLLVPKPLTESFLFMKTLCVCVYGIYVN